MTDGYLYCLSNPSIPDLLKVGMTERTPEDRVRELFKTGVPTPFKIEFAKQVSDPKQKEKTLHALLSQYTDRVSSKREFFRVSPEEVKTFFDLMDGEWWVENTDEDESVKTQLLDGKCRNMSKCFTDGQRIRHTIGINKTWIGIYDSSKNGIIYNDKIYQGRSPLNQFAKSHYEIERKDRTSCVNA
jgi:hypothetical protein